MTALERDVVFGGMPVTTWRWLGVNETRLPAALLESAPLQKLVTVPAGKAEALTVVCRDEAMTQIAVDLAAGASLHLTRVRLAAPQGRRADTVKAVLAEGARLEYTAVELGGALSASALDIDLAGDGSAADVAALYFAGGNQKLDLNYIIHQRGRDTKANMKVYGALSGKAEKIFRGTLDFLKGSAGSVGRESEEVTLLSPGVRNRSVPLMLAGEAEVDGHHATSIGKIDEEKLFYLLSRGLSPEEAKRLVAFAAIAPVLARIEDESLAALIRDSIEGRLSDD